MRKMQTPRSMKKEVWRCTAVCGESAGCPPAARGGNTGAHSHLQALLEQVDAPEAGCDSGKPALEQSVPERLRLT